MQVAHNRPLQSSMLVLYLVLTLFASTLHAQQLKFQHIGVEQGLSQDIVTSIAQDSLGFMWFGTEDGLNMYDGYGVTVFKNNSRDSNSLSSGVIRHLMVDSRGRLWIGTIGNVMEPETHNISHIGTAEGIDAFCEGEDSSIWFSTKSGLYRRTLDGKTSVIHTGAEIWLGVDALFFDKHTKLLFIGSASGLNIASVTNGTLIPRNKTKAQTAIDGHSVTAICQASNGDIFVGTINAGFFRLSSDFEQVQQYVHEQRDQQSLSDYRVLALAEDHQQRIWVGTFSGLDMFDRVSGKFTRYKDDGEANGLRGDRVYSICVDRSGTLWVGTYRGGVNRFDPYRQRFDHVGYEPKKDGGLHAQNAFSILETRDGDLWVGTEAGLFRRRTSTYHFLHYKHDPRDERTLSDPVVFALCERRNGELWAGLSDGVANRYDPVRQTFVHYKLPETNAIRVMYETRDGRLLVGTESRGSFVLDSISQRFVPWGVRVDSSQPDGGVWAMYQDSPGYVWLGTFYLPYILRVDPVSQSVKRIYPDPRSEGGFVNPSIRAFCETIHDTLYFGTWGSGFARFNRQKDSYTCYSENDGLCNNYVKAMQSDDRGRIWIATEKGLARFDTKTETFRTYTVEDGLQSNFFWSGSSWKGKDGKLYFGGTNGFNVFHPDSISENMNIPPVVITSVRVLDKPFPIPADRTINLSYESDFFSFEFVALDYTFPERNQYAYMLEGFDKDWVKSGIRRYAAYTHLDPGRYVFHVRGSNNDGTWNETGTTLAIIIAPPYWMTWWFRFLVLLALAGSLYALYRYRVRRLLEIERLRGRIAADLHDDVGSELGHIALASQLLLRKVSLPEKEQHQLSSISTSALHASEMMKEVVWFMNPTNDSLHNIILKMRSLAQTQLVGMEVVFEAPVEDLPDRMDPEVKRNIVLMYREILHNIARHAGATRVSIKIEIHSNRLNLTITDNGVGFAPDTASRGNGLNNLRSRTAQIGGNLTIRSTIGTGTTVGLNIGV